MAKRHRTDTVHGALEAAKSAALGPINPPAHVHLRAGDLPFWNSIVCARARSTWTDSDLETAANLARCKSDIERLQKEIDIEGDTLVNDRGTVVMNPKHSLLEVLSRRCMALSRMLHVHAEATVGESKDAGKALKAEREAKQAMQTTDDGLIARPRLVK